MGFYMHGDLHTLGFYAHCNLHTLGFYAHFCCPSKRKSLGKITAHQPLGIDIGRIIDQPNNLPRWFFFLLL